MTNQNDVLLSLNNRIRTIKFNRPQRKNAICKEMYITMTNILNEDAQNDNVALTIFTGAGEYYTSGNDFSVRPDEDMGATAELACKIVENFVAAIINYHKIIIAVVNGPAIGIGVTILPLCDVVYASDKATFHTPFLNMGVCPEACSSYTFPRVLGRSKASEMLFLGHKMNASEAHHFGLVSKVIEHRKLNSLFQQLEEYGKIPLYSMKVAKQLMIAGLKDILHEANKREMKQLGECLQSEEFYDAVSRFLSRKSKL